MAFYFALLNVSNKRSEDKNRQSQRHTARSQRQARRHSIASLDEQPLNDYRLLPKPLVVTNELATGHYLPNSASIKEEMNRARESSLSSRDETPPPPKIERNLIKANLRHSRQQPSFNSYKKNHRDNLFHDRRESSEIDEPTCSRRFDNDPYNNREDSASGEDEFRSINSRFRRGFSPLGSPVRTCSAKSSREESRRTSKASSNSSEIIASINGRYGAKSSQNDGTENKVIASKRVTFDNKNNSVIIEGHFLEERLHWADTSVPSVDTRLRTVTSVGDLGQHSTNQVKKVAANGVGSSEQYLDVLVFFVADRLQIEVVEERPSVIAVSFLRMKSSR
ncbi:unnamed protein product, partial [Mesorhabditis belari]|uniref:Uncharacterized protein n=1 Tax=Mesorhabditis belari TaxID=2138241 RepID=A0AAF3F0C6_9BILA